MGSEGTPLPSKARRSLGAAAASTATPAACHVLDPGARAAGAWEGGFPGPPPLSASRQHRDGNVEAVAAARSYHRQRVAQNRAAKVHPIGECLGEEVALGPEWAFAGPGPYGGKAWELHREQRPEGRSWGGRFSPLGLVGVWGRTHREGGLRRESK